MSRYDRRLLRPFAVPALAALGAPLHAIETQTAVPSSSRRRRS